MVEEIVASGPSPEIDLLHHLASMILSKHTNGGGLCIACGCLFPCEQAVLAEHNLSL